jgi:hypothetical protein
MFDHMKSLIKRELTKQELMDYVFNIEEHHWMRENQYVQAHFKDFFDRLPRRVMKKVFIQDQTIFVRANGRFACSVSNAYQSVVIIFPEVYNMLTKTYDGSAKAILAHELGHVYLDHTENMDDPMEAQVDADNFACEMGYLEELETFLHEQPDSVEKRVRLTFVSSYYFANNDM